MSPFWRNRKTVKTPNFNVYNFFPWLAEWRTCKILRRPHYECQRSSGCGQCACDVMPRQTDSLLWSCGKWLHINSYMMHILLDCTQVPFVTFRADLERVLIIVSRALSICFPPKSFALFRPYRLLARGDLMMMMMSPPDSVNSSQSRTLEKFAIPANDDRGNNLTALLCTIVKISQTLRWSRLP